MTPSCPTLSMTSAICFPIVVSELAEIVAICSISSLPTTGREDADKPLTITSTALSIPRLSSIGLAPAVTYLLPSVKIA